MGETSLPTEQPQACEAPRVPAPDVDARRAGHPGGAPPQGPPPAVRLRGPAAFAALARDGRRVRRGTVTVTWVAGDPAEAGSSGGSGSGSPRIAYAVGRRAGGAVVRNRIRRRLRAIVREVALTGQLRPGDYLIGAGAPAATLPYQELRTTVIDALRAAPAEGRRR